MKIKTLLGEWEVKLTDDPEKLRVNGTVGKGAVHYKERKVYVDSRINLPDRAKVLRHEFTHVTLYETQLDLNMEYEEEDLCELIAKYGEYIVELTRDILKKLG